MKTYQEKDRLPEYLRNVVLTFGNYDGVHKGHQELLKLTREKAESIGGQAVALTFEPHPVAFFRPGYFQLIHPVEEKLERLEREGMDIAVVFEFNEKLAGHSPRAFVRDRLLSLFDVKEIVIGYDTTFGKDRKGTQREMIAFGKEFGFETSVVDPVIVNGKPVSSSRVRKAVMAGDVSLAFELLGSPFTLGGRVVSGHGRGGELLGTPTANIETGNRLLPGPGVYAARIILGGERLPAAVNVGASPTFGDKKFSVEAHILDFDRDIYGEHAALEFVKRLRGEKCFDGLDQLKKQMEKDIGEVRNVLR